MKNRFEQGSFTKSLATLHSDSRQGCVWPGTYYQLRPEPSCSQLGCLAGFYSSMSSADCLQLLLPTAALTLTAPGARDESALKILVMEKQARSGKVTEILEQQSITAPGFTPQNPFNLLRAGRMGATFAFSLRRCRHWWSASLKEPPTSRGRAPAAPWRPSSVWVLMGAGQPASDFVSSPVGKSGD